MKTLYIERSVSTGRNGAWTNALDVDGVTRIVVGTGPGSFAGIRAAIAFAQGYALATGCEVLGLPSPCAVYAQAVASDSSVRTKPFAVVGDARQGQRWVALFEDFRLVREVFQVSASELVATLPSEALVATPDFARIGAELQAAFGARARGEILPTDEGLRLFAEENPAILSHEPRPIYLNPAVRESAGLL